MQTSKKYCAGYFFFLVFIQNIDFYQINNKGIKLYKSPMPSLQLKAFYYLFNISFRSTSTLGTPVNVFKILLVEVSLKV